MTTVDAEPTIFMPATWEGVNRVLIECCTVSDSELCKSSVDSQGCYCVRTTKDDDFTLESTVLSVLALIAAVPDGIPITIWSGIPCTGGSPIQNANKDRPGFARRMAHHLRLWHKLVDSFVLCAQAVIAKGGYVVLEWPSRCRYWRHPKVVSLLSHASLGWQSGRVRACAF